MQKVVIFDIDGTLADNSERQELLIKNKNDWKRFFSEMGNDKAIPQTIEIFNLIKKSGKYNMIIVTGRPDSYKELTEKWLTWNNIEYSKLYMRKEGDIRSDAMVKKDMLEDIRKNSEVSFVFDDRKAVVDMWRENGVFCFQCNDHTF